MRYVALLRGVNVGGNRKIAMADLREFAARVGLENPSTLLQSGNLVFGARARPTCALEHRLEEEAEKQLALRTDFVVRSAAEWEQVVARNPFSREARRDPSRFLVMFLKESPAKLAIDEIKGAHAGPETFHAESRELYVVFPNSVGTSKFPALLTEKRLGTRGTARNWNTVLKLLAAVRV